MAAVGANFTFSHHPGPSLLEIPLLTLHKISSSQPAPQPTTAAFFTTTLRCFDPTDSFPFKLPTLGDNSENPPSPSRS